MVRKKMLLAIITIAVIAIAVYNLPSPAPIPFEMALGTSPYEVSGLIYIAEEKGYFNDAGLNVTIHRYDAGLYAITDLNQGKLDVATAADYAVAGRVLAGDPIVVAGSIGTDDFHYLMIRKESGIAEGQDLRGRTIGVSKRTSGEFFLGRFLELHGLRHTDVVLIDLAPARMKEALAGGAVDAVVIWPPTVYDIEDALGDSLLIWPIQGGQKMYWLLIVPEEGDPAAIERLLRALQHAEEFAQRHPEEARRIVNQRLATPAGEQVRAWERTRMSLSLDQSLLIALEDEARWMIRENLTDDMEMPDYLSCLRYEWLDSIKPGSVRIIR